MKKIDYLIERIGINDITEAIRGKDIFYKCNICQSIVPSVPKDNIYCACNNINIDKDLNRIFVDNMAELIILRKKAKKDNKKMLSPQSPAARTPP